MIRSIGHMWSSDDVFWGARRQAGALLGVPYDAKRHAHIDFREQVGIYALYADFDLVYVGQTGRGTQRLLSRLKQHRDDHLSRRWNRFSWFGVRWVTKSLTLSAVAKASHPPLTQVLNHLEAILIETAEPPLNGQGGRFGNSVKWYRQTRDQHLGLEQGKMVAEIWRRTRDA